MWSESRRAHPAGVIVYSLRYLGSLAAPIVGVGYALMFALSDNATPITTLALVAGIVFAALIAIGVAWVHWYRFTFRIEGGSLRVEQGLLVRKSTRLSPERIQSVDTRANLLFRILGLVTVDIHTAGRGQEPEVSISALADDEAADLAEALRATHVQADAEAGEPAGETVAPRGPGWRLSGTELAIVAVTSGSGLLALAVFAPLVAALLPMFAEGEVAAYLETLGTGLLALVLAAFFMLLVLFAWIVGTVGTVLQYWEFVAARTNGEVRVERGLVQRNTRSVPLDRVQAVRLTEGLLRQLIGRVTVGVDAAGIGTGGELGPTVLHPLLTKPEVDRFCAQMVPGHERPALRVLPARSRRRYIVRALALPVAISVPIAVVVPFGWLALIVPVVSAAWSIWAFKDAGWGIGGDVLALRWRAVARSTALIRRRRVQSVVVSQHPLQKIGRLATISVRVAASPANATFRVRHVDEEDAFGVLEWVSAGVERADEAASEHASESV